jgi:Ca-activated chloride channel family protein
LEQQSPLYVDVLLDVSLSMSANDLQPNRLTVAKAAIADLIEQLPGASFGLIVFSGIPLEQFPYSTYQQAVMQHVESIHLADYPLTSEFVGTAIGDALLVGVDRLRSRRERTGGEGVIVLISDGDSSR